MFKEQSIIIYCDVLSWRFQYNNAAVSVSWKADLGKQAVVVRMLFVFVFLNVICICILYFYLYLYYNATVSVSWRADLGKQAVAVRMLRLVTSRSTLLAFSHF